MLKRVRHLLAIVFESPNWQNKLVGYKKAASLLKTRKTVTGWQPFYTPQVKLPKSLVGLYDNFEAAHSSPNRC
jgi:hypothetical protein